MFKKKEKTLFDLMKENFELNKNNIINLKNNKKEFDYYFKKENYKNSSEVKRFKDINSIYGDLSIKANSKVKEQFEKWIETEADLEIVSSVNDQYHLLSKESEKKALKETFEKIDNWQP
jgi:hypothetical protein